MPTMTFPISRIEGHAQAVIDIREGRAVRAYFQATEFRGFERFLQGTPAEDVIVIVPRICGVCATARITWPPSRLWRGFMGPLIHHYRIENGAIANARFIIPTVFNVGAIEHALGVAARRYITGNRVDLELENAVGRVVRAFDPCIACATH